ncbi:MAG TPA: hypothetical protein VEA44_16105 [Caulobacter sp.]|nr:hypothetical protein [Caulobacter sp.]
MALALGMDPSDLNRRLKSKADLSERHARLARDFMAGEEPPPIAAKPAYVPPSRLPVLGYAAGDSGELVLMNEGDPIDWLDLPQGIALSPGEYFVVRHAGPSMEPKYFPGANHVIRRNYPPGYGRGALIELKNGHGAVKLYKGERDGKVWGEQFNPPKQVDFPSTQVKAVHAIMFTLD